MKTILSILLFVPLIISAQTERENVATANAAVCQKILAFADKVQETGLNKYLTPESLEVRKWLTATWQACDGAKKVLDKSSEGTWATDKTKVAEAVKPSKLVVDAAAETKISKDLGDAKLHPVLAAIVVEIKDALKSAQSAIK